MDDKATPREPLTRDQLLSILAAFMDVVTPEQMEQVRERLAVQDLAVPR